MSRAYLRAAGCVSVHGAGLAALRDAIARGDAPSVRDAPAELALSGLPAAGWLDPLPRPERWTGKPARLGRMDRLSHLALCAAEAAVQRAGGLHAGERAALVLGTAFGAHLSNELFWRGVRAGGSKGASPAIFAYTLPSAACGELAIHFGLRGPCLTLAQGRGAGVAALAEAAALCEEGRAETVLAGAADSLGAALCARRAARVPCEGAAFFVIAREPGAAPLARLAGSGHASGEGAPARARRAACARAGLGDAHEIDGEPAALGDGLASGPLCALALALEALPPPLPCLLNAVDREAGTADAICLVRP